MPAPIRLGWLGSGFGKYETVTKYFVQFLGGFIDSDIIPLSFQSNSCREPAYSCADDDDVEKECFWVFAIAIWDDSICFPFGDSTQEIVGAGWVGKELQSVHQTIS
jgi:hypothetical protein